MSIPTKTGTVAFVEGEPNATELMRISAQGITANPDIEVDVAAQKILEILSTHIKYVVTAAVKEERNRCISIIENYKIHVGASTAGEIACEMTYEALRQIRDEINGVKDDE